MESLFHRCTERGRMRHRRARDPLESFMPHLTGQPLVCTAPAGVCSPGRTDDHTLNPSISDNLRQSVCVCGCVFVCFM